MTGSPILKMQMWRIDKRWIHLRNIMDGLERKLLEANSSLPNSRMCEFLVLAEDRRFPRHPGFDILALLRAAWKTLFCHSRQGGSTIAMQLVRTMEGRREATLRRKITEIVLAVLLSRYLPTHRIPVLYLWSAYYGWNMEGFERACLALRIDPQRSTASEDAYLVACLKYPQRKSNDPAHKARIRRRAAHIIRLAAQCRPGGKA